MRVGNAGGRKGAREPRRRSLTAAPLRSAPLLLASVGSALLAEAADALRARHGGTASVQLLLPGGDGEPLDERVPLCSLLDAGAEPSELAELSLQYDYEPLVAPDCPLLMLEPTRLASKYNASG